MNKNEVMSKVDHTLLTQTATWEEIERICSQAMKYQTASVCIPPSYVKRAAQYLGGRIKVCTVIGFPNGYQTTNVKMAETEDAIQNGADEIDMVININRVKDDRFEEVLQEVKEIRAACEGKVLKVIIETCLLTKEEKLKMCEIVTKAGADYIKTSTGFSTGGATFEDVALLQKYVGDSVKVKAAGGISSLEDAERFLRLGADRLGTSRLIALCKSTD